MAISSLRSTGRLAGAGLRVWLRRNGEVRPARVLLRIALFGSAALVISGIGHALLNPARDESPEAAALIAALISGESGHESVPVEIIERLGYEPVIEGSSLVDPSGSCSTPGGVGPSYFTNACRGHDLGYDILRSYAESGRLGAWARFELDRHLYRELLGVCATVKCRATATAYFAAITTNSMRQGYKVPTDEPTMPWVGVGLIVVGLASIPSIGGSKETSVRLLKLFPWLARGVITPCRQPISLDTLDPADEQPVVSRVKHRGHLDSSGNIGRRKVRFRRGHGAPRGPARPARR
jgi:hypothetical protein